MNKITEILKFIEEAKDLGTFLNEIDQLEDFFALERNSRDAYRYVRRMGWDSKTESLNTNLDRKKYIQEMKYFIETVNEVELDEDAENIINFLYQSTKL